MTNDEIRNRILQVLYDDYQKYGSASSMPREDLISKVQVDEMVIEREFDYLFEKGLVDRPCFGHVQILTNGIDKVERSPEFSPSTTVPQKIEIHGGNIGQINQAHTINNPSLFLNQLSEAIQRADIDPQKKASWTKSLWEMSKHPVITEAVKILLSSCA